MKMFQIHDSAAEAYLPPFFVLSTGLALRSFTDAANAEDHNFAKHAADYTLFEIGAQDPSTGLITLLEPQVNLGKALDYITRDPFVPGALAPHAVTLSEVESAIARPRPSAL